MFVFQVHLVPFFYFAFCFKLIKFPKITFFSYISVKEVSKYVHSFKGGVKIC